MPFGRKGSERDSCVFLTSVRQLSARGLAETEANATGDPIFLNCRGGRLTTRGVAGIVDVHVRRLAQRSARTSAHLAPYLRNPYAGCRGGSPIDSGTLGSREPVHNSEIHPRLHRATRPRLPLLPPPRQVKGKSPSFGTWARAITWHAAAFIVGLRLHRTGHVELGENADSLSSNY